VGLLVVLLVLALVFGVGGLILEGLRWLLIIALVLLIASFISGFASRGRSSV
jgi:hypothetical protein